MRLLTESAEKGDVKNPGIKLLTFYEGTVASGQKISGGNGSGETVLETVKTRAESEGLRGLRAVGEEWMGRWLRQWEREGFCTSSG